MDSIHENFSSAVLPDFFIQKLLCIFYPDVDVFCKCNNTIEKNRLFLLLFFHYNSKEGNDHRLYNQRQK